ncbi:MAG: transporter substrate binding protein [Chloroflexi bacterium]|nr:transporter substrate binding protein [Chloroflexota bacterium]
MARWWVLIRLALALQALAVGCSASNVQIPSGAPQKIPRVAYLSPGARALQTQVTDAFLTGLGELGYVEDQNLDLRYWFVDDVGKPVSDVAADLVRESPDVIVALGAARVAAAKQATETIPIVMAQVADAVEAGLVASLARPAGNVTGTSSVTGELAAKRLDILTRAVPTVSRVAVLSTPQWTVANSPADLQWRGVQQAANDLRIEVRLVEVRGQRRSPETIAAVEQAIENAAADGAEAIYPLSDALFDALRSSIASASLQAGLPSIYRRQDFVEVGGLMSYGSNMPDEFRRIAYYVDRILKGANPRDLPVSLPTRFDFAIGAGTAAALQITIPDSVLAQVTRVISQ